MDNIVSIILNITLLLLPISKLVEHRTIKRIKKKDTKSKIRIALQEIQYQANVYHATFYTLDNYSRPYMTLMKKVKDTYMLIETSTNYLSIKNYKKAKEYLTATYNNLLFSVDRLHGYIKHEEWRILPDKEQQNGYIFTLYQKAQKALK